MKEAIIDYNVQRNADQVYATIVDKKYLHNDPNSSCMGRIQNECPSPLRFEMGRYKTWIGSALISLNRNSNYF